MGERTLSLLARPRAECSVVLVDDAAMAVLNRTYRGIASPTDVLAFPMIEGRFRDVSPDLLGDVVISTETARRQALATGGGVRGELALLLVHGILHLLGYDHGTPAERRNMRRKQRLILMACDIQGMGDRLRGAKGTPAARKTAPGGSGQRGARR